MAARTILPYERIPYGDPLAAYQPYDERCPAVARRAADLIQASLQAAEVEHVGSTAIPGCAGKGVVDLMLVYPDGSLAAARAAAEALGFQLFLAREPFPPERPVYVGMLPHDAASFRIHLHLISASSPEVTQQRRFRDRLRSDPALVAEYQARKRAVLTAGVADSTAYNAGKDAFIRRVLDLPDETPAR